MSPVRFVLLLFILTATETTAFAQPGTRLCVPIAQRADNPGPACVTAKEQIGEPSHGIYFWHLYVFPDRAQGEADKQPHSTVVESPGKVWLVTIAKSSWASTTGTFVAKLVPSSKLANPQSWNLYSYVLNNPLMNVDPSGLDCMYANDAGNRVESIDHNSNATECGDPKSGGTSVPGYVSEDHAAYNSNTGQFQVASFNRGNVYYVTFGAGAQTDANGNCSSGCRGYGFASADAAWLSSMIVGGTLDQMMTFMVDQDVGIHGMFGPSDPGTVMQILCGPFDFWKDHWAGPDGMAIPSGKGDWAAIAHDYNYDTNHVTISMYFNPFISRATAHAVIQSNNNLIRNAGGFQGAKMGLFFGVVDAFQWVAHAF